MATVWVYADVAAEGPTVATLELMTKARSLAGDVDAIALGPGASEAAGPLGDHGARRVFASDDSVYEQHLAQPAAHAVAGLIAEHGPDMILFTSSQAARDVAGRLQALTGSTLLANATDVPGLDTATTQMGDLVVEVALEGPRPHLILVRPKSFTAEPIGVTADVVPVEVEVPGELTRALVTERHEEATAGPKLEEARVVLAGGRGMQDPSNFALLDRLAAAIGGAAVGASRAVVDAGWVPHSYQIGQTGKTVKPEVYVAVGISGAIQHVAGMKGSKRIVAINKDPNAPILRLADLGVVGDALAILPALTDEVQRRKG